MFTDYLDYVAISFEAAFGQFIGLNVAWILDLIMRLVIVFVH
jgi:hypothetical protein